jgi:NTE family protein
MSLPVIMNPWPLGERLLIDGAVVNPLPARVLRDAGVGFVIGSNVAGQEAPSPRGDRSPPNLLRVVLRMINSMERELIKGQAPLVDVMIRPRVYAETSFDFRSMLAFEAEGARAARQELPAIQRAVLGASR